MHDDWIADLDPFHLFADLLDPPSVLVTHYEREQLVAGWIGVGSPDTFNNVKIRAAYARAADTNDDIG